MAPHAIVTNKYGKIGLSVKYNPVVNSGMVYAGFRIKDPVINTTIIKNNAPKIG